MKWVQDMTIINRVSALVIIGLTTIFNPGLAYSDLPDTDKQFTTLDIVETTAKQIPDCIDYCVTGACIHVQYLFPAGIKVIISPKVEHYLPDYLVQVYKEPEEEPYKEWSKVFGPAKKSIMSDLLALMGGAAIGAGGHDVSDLEYQHGDRETFYKEADVIGHPLTLLPKILSKDGSLSAATSMGGDLGAAAQLGSNGTIEAGDFWCDWENGTCDDGFTENEEGCGPDCHDDDITVEQAFEIGAEGAAEYLSNFGDLSGVFLDPRITRVFNVVDAVEEVTQAFETVNELMEVVDQIQQLSDAVGGIGVGVSGEFRIDDILCDTPLLPFVPYYLSSIDSFFWRNGWPLTDIEHAEDVLNPLSDERVSLGLDEWGNLFPRHGFLHQYHDRKASATIAARAVDVTVDDSSYRIRIPPPARPDSGDWEGKWDHRWTAGKWSEMHPNPSSECHTSVAYGGDAVDSGGRVEGGSYAWTFWRKYECCLQTSGSYVETVDIPESCVL